MSIFKNNNINNPFGVPNTARPNLGALASKILSDRDAARFKSILGEEGEQNPGNSSIEDILVSGLEGIMDNEERKKLEEEKERRDPLKRIIAWAKKYDLGDENWVKKYFEFEDDGTFICNANLKLDSMTEPDFPESIKYVNGSLSLNGLTSAVGLNLPDKIEYSLYLNNLTSAEGLNLPDEIKDLYLNGLTSTKDLNLPDKIGGSLALNGLTSAEGLNLPDEIKDLYLNGLTSAVGLKLPKEIERTLSLKGLTSAEGLDLTYIEVGGFIYLEKVPNNEKQELRKKYYGLNIS